MKYQIQVLGVPNGETSPSCSLQFDLKSFLFNTGEGTQRFCNEHKAKLVKVCNIFFTRLHWDCVGGLPGMLLTLADISDQKITLHGPLGLGKFIDATKNFIHRSNISHVHEYVDASSCYQDEDVVIKPIVINVMNSNQSIEFKRKFDEMVESKSLHPPVINYLCQGPSKLGKFNAKAALALGLKPGAHYKQLLAGHNVQLEDGRIIEPHQCVGPREQGKIFTIIDCPSKEYIEPLKQQMNKNLLLKGQSMNLMIHMLGDGILQDSEYMQWMESWGKDVKHMIFSPQHASKAVVFKASTRMQHQLSLLDPNIFQIPPVDSSSSESAIESSKFVVIGMTHSMIENVRIAHPLLRYQLEPKAQYDEADALRPLEIPPMNEAFLEQIQLLPKHQEQLEEDANDFQVIPLGTGSAIPGKYRNVSCTLLRMKSMNLLLDAGEGSLGQMRRLFGEDQFLKELERIHVIFISHLHADHHLGLIRIFKELEIKYPQKRLHLIAPLAYYQFLEKLQDLENFLASNVNFISSEMLLNSEFHQFKIPHVEHFKTIKVDHCPSAFAAVIQTECNHKIAYSGDCRPSMEFAVQGQGADLLIHEATFEEEKLEEAIKKKHSTIKEAIDVGLGMKAKNLLLTHFSQRYPKCPNVESLCIEGMNVAFAFDLMRMSVKRDFVRMQQFLPAFKALFKEEDTL